MTVARETTVSGSIWIDVAPAVAYDAVSDVTQMGRWSPENTGATIERPRDAAYVGMGFVGSNRRGPARWQTRCRVTAAEPGHRFAFEVHGWGFSPMLLPVALASWQYLFEERDGGTLVTEEWRDGRTRWPELSVRLFDPVATGRASFAAFQRGNIARTLKNLKRELEHV